MATDKQIQANRRNALKSTGPRTHEGKAAIRLNAFKHGIFAESHTLIGEDQAAFDALRDDFLDRFQPAAPEEEALVAALIDQSWLLVRFRRLEATTWNMRLTDPISNYPMVTAHILACKELDYLQRRINSTHRQFHRDLEVLTKLQAARKTLEDNTAAAAPAPRPIVQAVWVEPVKSEIGFVSPNLKPLQNRPHLAPANPAPIPGPQGPNRGFPSR